MKNNEKLVVQVPSFRRGNPGKKALPLNIMGAEIKNLTPISSKRNEKCKCNSVEIYLYIY